MAAAIAVIGFVFAMRGGSGSDARPVAEGTLGVFICVADGERPESEVVSEWRQRIGGADSLLVRKTDFQTLPFALGAKEFANGEAAKWAEKYNAHALIGLGDGSGGATGELAGESVFVYLRPPPDTPQIPRPDLNRFSTRLIYPDSVRYPYRGEEDWAWATEVVRAHLYLALGRTADLQRLPDLPSGDGARGGDWSSLRGALGGLALASAVSARADSSLLNVAVELLGSAWPDGRPSSPAERSRWAEDTAKLASALMVRKSLHSRLMARPC
ncbi:MAG: hypothetical protein IID54_07410 [Proteobacteria bacterium]|nr:hypothetical protein [Pseudomonadota bacterium]